jgi:hypothetical protein
MLNFRAIFSHKCGNDLFQSQENVFCVRVNACQRFSVELRCNREKQNCETPQRQTFNSDLFTKSCLLKREWSAEDRWRKVSSTRCVRLSLSWNPGAASGFPRRLTSNSGSTMETCNSWRCWFCKKRSKAHQNTIYCLLLILLDLLRSASSCCFYPLCMLMLKTQLVPYQERDSWTWSLPCTKLLFGLVCHQSPHSVSQPLYRLWDWVTKSSLKY